MNCEFQTEQLDSGKYKHVCSICGFTRINNRPELLKRCSGELIEPVTAKQHRIMNFTKAMIKFVVQGRGKFLSLPQVEARLEICKLCPQFTGNHCKLCGCRCNKNKFLNKLSIPTECCPDDPPRWKNEI